MDDSMNSLFKDNRTMKNNDDKLYNPLKIDQNAISQAANIFSNQGSSQILQQGSATFKPIPLPDDILGLDMAPQSFLPNYSFNIDNFIKEDTINGVIDNDFLDADFENNFINMQTLNQEYTKNDDIENVLLDLGISEIPLQSEPAQQTSKPRHQKKVSGSGIFGFVGVGNDSQLEIPGFAPVTFMDKKPLYKETQNFENTIYNNIPIVTENNSILEVPSLDLQPPSPIKYGNNSEKRRLHKDDYFVSSGNQRSYKFPPSPPKGSFENAQNTTTINPFCTQQTRKNPLVQLESQSIQRKKSPLPTPLPTSPLNSVAMSSPIKDFFQTPSKNSPTKMMQAKFTAKFNQINNEINETVDTDDDKDRTISQYATPLKIRSTNINVFQTPSPNKSSTNLNWNPTTVTKHNLLTEEILRAQKSTPVRKKPTITSTLASGTLDKFFSGPTSNGKFICRFFDKEIGTTCKREFSRISNVRAHIQTHLCDRPFACDKCGKRFVRNHDLTRHQKGHSEFANVCPCGKKFPRADALRRHRSRNICPGGISSNNGVSKSSKNKEQIMEQNKRMANAISNLTGKSITPDKTNDLESIKIENSGPTSRIITQDISKNNNHLTGENLELFDFNKMGTVTDNFLFDLDKNLDL